MSPAPRYALIMPDPGDHDGPPPADAQDPRDDAALVAAVREGEPGAFDTLYHRHRDTLYRMAYRLARDEHRALDAVQEAFVYLIKKLNDRGFELNAGVRLTTLLYPVMRSRVIDRARVQQRFAGDAEATLDRLVADSVPPPTDHDDLRRVLDALPATQREAIELNVLEGYTQAQVAEATGVALGTVKSRLHHALRKLREDAATREFFEPL